MVTGIVIKAINGYYYVKSECFDMAVQCKLRGRFKKEHFSLTVGDRVQYVLLDDGTGIIEVIEPRTTLLKRPLTANVDQVILTFAAAQPDLNPLLLDRFIILAEHAQLTIVICINKIDLAEPAIINPLVDEYRALGYDVLCVSAKQNYGIEALRDKLKDKISVFAGPSGVGKSTLLNTLDKNLRLSTGSLSNKIRRGKHTTRVAELLPFVSGGYVVDTPGFSFTEFNHIKENELAQLFPEFCRITDNCRYSTCLHSHEPQCVIKQAVADNTISSRRYDSYLNILKEIQGSKKGF